MARKTKAQLKRERDREIKQWITVVILFALMIIGLMKSGVVGLFLFNLQRYLLGFLFWVILGSFIIMILMNVMNRHHENDDVNPVPFILVDCAKPPALSCNVLFPTTLPTVANAFAGDCSPLETAFSTPFT